MTAVTVTLRHNAARDPAGRRIALLEGYPGDPMVRAFTYQADPAGRTPDEIAEEAFALADGHPQDTASAELSRRHYQELLRSLSFPGNRRCCSRSCCSPRPRRVVQTVKVVG